MDIKIKSILFLLIPCPVNWPVYNLNLTDDTIVKFIKAKKFSFNQILLLPQFWHLLELFI